MRQRKRKGEFWLIFWSLFFIVVLPLMALEGLIQFLTRKEYHLWDIVGEFLVSTTSWWW